jgi:hypothetical protein
MRCKLSAIALWRPIPLAQVSTRLRLLFPIGTRRPLAHWSRFIRQVPTRYACAYRRLRRCFLSRRGSEREERRIRAKSRSTWGFGGSRRRRVIRCWQLLRLARCSETLDTFTTWWLLPAAGASGSQLALDTSYTVFALAEFLSPQHAWAAHISWSNFESRRGRRYRTRRGTAAPQPRFSLGSVPSRRAQLPR